MGVATLSRMNTSVVATVSSVLQAALLVAITYTPRRPRPGVVIIYANNAGQKHLFSTNHAPNYRMRSKLAFIHTPPSTLQKNPVFTI